MENILNNISNPLVYSLIIIIIVAIVLTALRGRIRAKFGDKIIDIGKENKENDDKPASLPATAVLVQKRSCGDCILLLMGEREKYEFNTRKESNKILKIQMTYAEQKLETIQTLLLDSFTEHFKKESVIDESIQYKLLYGLLKDMMYKVKDEIRRSFKDNDFSDISTPEFATYLKEKNVGIISILTQYVRNMYPDKEGILEASKIIKIIENKGPFLSEMINNIYVYARDTKVEINGKIKQMQEQFVAWVDNFIK